MNSYVLNRLVSLADTAFVMCQFTYRNQGFRKYEIGVCIKMPAELMVYLRK